MRINKLKSVYFTFLLGSIFVLFNPACSSNDAEIEEEVDGEEGDQDMPKAEAASELANIEKAQPEVDAETDDIEDEEVVEESAEGETDEVASSEPQAAEAPPVVIPEEVSELPALGESAPAVEEAPTPESFSGSPVVQYVRNGNAKLLSAPGGQVVKSLDKGDHLVVVSMQNGFAQLDNGLFVAAKSLSMKPIGRDRNANSWK